MRVTASAHTPLSAPLSRRCVSTSLGTPQRPRRTQPSSPVQIRSRAR